METTDIIDISAEAKSKAKETRNPLKEMESQYQSFIKQLESAKQQGEAVGEEIQTRIKCMRIAMRIMFGDKVPKADHRYLADKDPDLYAKALSMRMENKNPKEYKRISEDEEPDEEAESDSVRTESPEVSVEVQTEESGEATAESEA